MSDHLWGIWYYVKTFQKKGDVVADKREEACTDSTVYDDKRDCIDPPKTLKMGEFHQPPTSGRAKPKRGWNIYSKGLTPVQ